MAKISKLIIEKILEAAKIEEVIEDSLGTYDQNNRSGIKKRGVRYHALCPWHDDRHLGSFVIYPKGNCYKCFVCGKKGGVIEWLMDYEHLSYPDALRYLGKKYNIKVDDVEIDYTPPPPKPTPPPLPTLELPKRIMAGGLLKVEDNTLVKWIRTGINWDTVQRSRIDQVLNHYAIGNSQQGMAIFWQMDEQGKLRTGKMMKYRTDGHRDKQTGYNFDWIHSALSRKWVNGEAVYEAPWPHPDLFNPDEQEMRSCYFGLHLLDKYKRKDVEQTVNIVESEKTAILMAIAYGNNVKQVWMACGGIENINRDKLKPIIDQKRRIILYPDRDGIEKWRIKCEQLHYDRVTLNTEPVTKWWKPEDGEKADIADVVIRMINESKPLTNMKAVGEAMPQVKPIIDKLNLEIDNGTTEQREIRSDGNKD